MPKNKMPLSETSVLLNKKSEIKLKGVSNYKS